MSLKLLKQSLDIVEDDLEQRSGKKTPAKGKLTRQATQDLLRKGGIAKEHIKEKRNIIDVRRELSMGQKKADENMRRLLALSQNSVKIADAEKIVKRAHKGRYVEVELPKVEQTSIFTEEDFQAFEREYFNS